MLLSLDANTLFTSCHFEEPSIESVLLGSCLSQWGYRGLLSTRRTRLGIAGGVRGVAGSVDSEGLLIPRIFKTRVL